MKSLFSLACVLLALSHAFPSGAQPPPERTKPPAAEGKAPAARAGAKHQAHAPGHKSDKGRKTEGHPKGRRPGARAVERASGKPANSAVKGERGPGGKDIRGEGRWGLGGAFKDERSLERKVRDTARSVGLKKLAERLRAKGKEVQAAGLEKRARRVAEGREIRNNKAAWKKALQARKLTRLKKLRQRYGKKLETKTVQDELSRHGRVSARLSRMQELAEEKGDSALLDRIKKLRERESARHEKRMTKLSSAKLDDATGQVDTKPAASANSQEETK